MEPASKPISKPVCGVADAGQNGLAGKADGRLQWLPGRQPVLNARPEEEILIQVFTLLLGRHVAHLNLPAAELLERLAASLNTVFDSLNRLIGAIQSTLVRCRGPEETIRHAISDHLGSDEDRLKLLEDHIGQISRAFLLTQQAFKTAAERIVHKMLQELDPATIGKEPPKGLHFGPFRKAESFEAYEQKFQQCQKWFESGRFMEDLMREFERACEGKTTY